MSVSWFTALWFAALAAAVIASITPKRRGIHNRPSSHLLAAMDDLYWERPRSMKREMLAAWGMKYGFMI